MVKCNMHPVLKCTHRHEHTQEKAVFRKVLVDVAKVAVKRKGRLVGIAVTSQGAQRSAVMCYPTWHCV